MKFGGIGSDCWLLDGVSIEGQGYLPSQNIDFSDESNVDEAAFLLENWLNSLLDAQGLLGDVEVFVSAGIVAATYHVTISNTTADEVVLLFANADQSCQQQLSLEQGACCMPQLDLSDLGGVVPYSPNADLFYEQLTYTGLDITRIDYSGSCDLGLMRNEYTYDANHRVVLMENELFGSNPVAGAYNTSYSYDLAGNILSLTRNGLVGIDATSGMGQYAPIDDLSYSYEGGLSSVLSSVVDNVSDPVAQAEGFGSSSPSSVYSYDAAGNLIEDSGKSLQIAYNILNLPNRISSTEDASEMLIDYSYGGSKLRVLTTDADGASEERVYFGGFELVDGSLELYQHGEGRVVFSTDGMQHYQYRIADHLGNTAVYFEDLNGDGLITSDAAAGAPSEVEVLQRSYYYPFGLPMRSLWDFSADPTAPWPTQTTPTQRYLYNGKELHAELGLNWYDYGARWYDAAVGRFPCIDPLAERFAWVSPYNYAENEPVGHVDLWGLQAVLPDKGEFEKEESNVWKIVHAGYRSVRIKQHVIILRHESLSVIYNPYGDTRMSDFALKRLYEGKLSGLYAGYRGTIRTLGELFREASLIYSEIIVCANPQVEEIYGDALKVSSESYGKVFRHIAFQALLANVYNSDFAKAIGDFYERINPNTPIEVSYRDLINNAYGRLFGSKESFDFSSKEGIAEFLNKTAKYVNDTFGLSSGDLPAFTSESKVVIDIYNALNQ